MKVKTWLQIAVAVMVVSIILITRQSWWPRVALVLVGEPKPFSCDLSSADVPGEPLQFFVCNQSPHKLIVWMEILLDSTKVYEGFIPPGGHNHLSGKVIAEQGSHVIAFRTKGLRSTAEVTDTVSINGPRWIHVKYTHSPTNRGHIHIGKHVGMHSGLGLGGV